MVALPQGSLFFGNQNSPKIIVGATYPPLGYSGTGSTMTTTLNRCYYFPIAIQVPTTFAGAVAMNSGAADNGKKFRLMIFRDDAANGGPGTLEKDFGEVTLSGASAVRTLASSWAARPGNFWGATWHDSAAAMYGMTPGILGAATSGYTSTMLNMIGDLTATPTVFGTQGSITAAHYVDTAYGAAPATAVAPTASLLEAFTSATPVVPAVLLKG